MAFSQPATFNEEWTDERVASYLNQHPPVGINADFHVLSHAYKHMRPDDFKRLLKLFTAQGRNIAATNPQGQTIYDVIQQYPRQSQAYLEILDQFVSHHPE